MTRVTANIILLVMCAVWAWLSIKNGRLEAVSDNFIYLGGIIAAGDIGAILAAKYKERDRTGEIGP